MTKLLIDDNNFFSLAFALIGVFSPFDFFVDSDDVIDFSRSIWLWP
jgi:hypothetical protein